MNTTTHPTQQASPAPAPLAPTTRPPRPAGMPLLDWAAWGEPNAASDAAHAAWLADVPMSWLTVAPAGGLQ